MSSNFHFRKKNPVSFKFYAFTLKKKDPLDSKKYLESYEKVLISWTSIKDILFFNDQTSNSNEYSNLIFKNYSKTIVEAFLQSRLSSYCFEADKESIQLNNDGVDGESIDGEDSSEDDLHSHREILYSIGEFSKYSLDFCLPMLSK